MKHITPWSELVMSDFPQKKFEGQTYTFEHLKPMTLRVAIGNPATYITLKVTFGCHCFTEEFVVGTHVDHHSYRYKDELRAFEMQRYLCSLQLPDVIQKSLLLGTIYNAGESLTYAAHISLEGIAGQQDYSIFFNLERDKSSAHPTVCMFVKSAYLKPLVAKQGAQNWRFKGLLATISGAFPPPEKKPKPVKKKKAKTAD